MKTIKLFAALLIIGFSGVLTSCQKDEIISPIKNSVPVSSKVIPISHADELNLDLEAAYISDSSSENKITIYVDERYFSKIQVIQEGNSLRIKSSETLPANVKPQILIHMKDAAKKVNLSGGSSFQMNKTVHMDQFSVVQKGDGDLNLNVVTNTFILNSSGNATVNCVGKVKKAIFTLDGSVQVDAGDLNVDTAEIHMSQNARAGIRASEMIMGVVSGKSILTYYGRPAQFNVLGGGVLQPK